jgi:hypothetical protein
VVAATLGLSACGTTTKATIDQSVASLGAQPDLQVHLTGTASGAGTTEVQKVLAAISVDLRLSNPSGGSLSQGAKTASGEYLINVGSSTLADIRSIGGNGYLMINATALSSIPGVNISAEELAAVQLVLGGRWFEIPKSLIASELPKSGALSAQEAKDQALEGKLLDVISKVIDTAPAKALSGGGYSETGTIASIVKAVEPTISTLTTIPSSANSVKGTYTLTLTNSGSSATGASVTITAPHGTTGNASVSLAATITHDDDAITVPTGATVITPALLKELEGSALGVSGATAL